MSYKLTLMVCLALTSCSTLDLAKTAFGMDDKPSIDIKAQVGKTNIINDGLVNVDSGDRIDVDKIDTFDKSDKRTGDNNDNSQTNIPWWVYVIGMVCALFVRPVEVWKRITGKSVGRPYGDITQ